MVTIETKASSEAYHNKVNMKEIIVLFVLVLTTFYASFSEGAIRRVCYNVADNSTNHENCKINR